MPQKIIIVRHGETDYNKERRMQGWLDVPLNQAGRDQAEIAAKKLANVKVDAIYSSDLVRAHKTAQIIAKTLKQKILTTPALRERDMGIFAGWAWEIERDPVKDNLWVEFETTRNSGILDWNKHQGESMRQMVKRIQVFTQEIEVIHPNQTILLVTHGGAINRLLEHYQLKLPSDGFRMITNASVLVIYKETTSYRLEEL